jgi:hypothetical protein
MLQKTLDYACGGGADCRPILQNGACFAPNTVKAHCSYAVNSYYQRSGQNPQACLFSGTTFVSNNDPSAYTLIPSPFLVFLPSYLSFPPNRTVQCFKTRFCFHNTSARSRSLMLRLLLLAGANGCVFPATQG